MKTEKEGCTFCTRLACKVFRVLTKHFTISTDSLAYTSAAAHKCQVSWGPEVQASFSLLEDMIHITSTRFNMSGGMCARVLNIVVLSLSNYIILSKDMNPRLIPFILPTRSCCYHGVIGLHRALLALSTMGVQSRKTQKAGQPLNEWESMSPTRLSVSPAVSPQQLYSMTRTVTLNKIKWSIYSNWEWDVCPVRMTNPYSHVTFL